MFVARLAGVLVLTGLADAYLFTRDGRYFNWIWVCCNAIRIRVRAHGVLSTWRSGC